MTAVATAQTRQRRPWKPDHNDHEIFTLVRMKGKTQEWVAEHLGISQPTVSRVLERYERWQAHANDREARRLAHAERLRSQRWLTFERNERILCSCLRIADQMEGKHYATKTTREQATHKEPEGLYRTQQEEIDKSGVAARFYRLAFRINMEQLQLAEQDPLPELPPLSAEELEEEEFAAGASTAEIQAAIQAEIDRFDRAHAEDMEQDRETERLKKIEEAERLALAEEILQQASGGREPTEAAGVMHHRGTEGTESANQEPTEESRETVNVPETHASDEIASEQPAPNVNRLNNLHKKNGSSGAATPRAVVSCGDSGRPQKNGRAKHRGTDAERRRDDSAAIPPRDSPTTARSPAKTSVLTVADS